MHLFKNYNGYHYRNRNRPIQYPFWISAALSFGAAAIITLGVLLNA